METRGRSDAVADRLNERNDAATQPTDTKLNHQHNDDNDDNDDDDDDDDDDDECRNYGDAWCVGLSRVCQFSLLRHATCCQGTLQRSAVKAAWVLAPQH